MTGESMFCIDGANELNVPLFCDVTGSRNRNTYAYSLIHFLLTAHVISTTLRDLAVDARSLFSPLHLPASPSAVCLSNWDSGS